MKIDIDTVREPTMDERYQVGNVFLSEEGELFLVIQIGDNSDYALLSLHTNKVVSREETFDDFLGEVSSSTDKLIDVKIVRA